MPELVMRPVATPSGAAHARRMLELGIDTVEQRDGRLWAVGPERRKTPRPQ
jgi:hypothetical protein